MIRPDERILALCPADHFVGRESELDQLLDLAGSAESGGIDILCSPGAGSTELLLQAFDRLFRNPEGVIPFYFALRPTDRSPIEAARRYLREFLTQVIAFRRRDPSIIDSAPDLNELSELALPSDGLWVDRLVESARSCAGADHSLVPGLISAPARAAAHGVQIFALIDELELSMFWGDDESFVSEMREVFGRAGLKYAFAGARRFMFGQSTAASMEINVLDFHVAGSIIETMAKANGRAISGQARDLLAVQLAGNLEYTKALITTAAERGSQLETFRSVESLYTEEIFGGRISRSLDAAFRQIVPEELRMSVVGLLHDCLNSPGGKMSIASWRRHLDIGSDVFHTIMKQMDVLEMISLQSGEIRAEIHDRVLSDYLIGRFRLEVAGEPRALVIGEALTEHLRRAPALLARIYRRNAAFGLQELLASFDRQEVAAAAIDYGSFKTELKGLETVEIESALRSSSDTLTLPQIVYTAYTAAFYPKIAEIIDDERSTIALGFEENGYQEQTVWIAAEIDSKLEASRELTEFWCDRLEMVAVSCSFEKYKMWLIAPEGFSDEALEILKYRNAFGSSRRQVELLRKIMADGKTADVENDAKEYEIVLPMGDETEMIAAHAVEDIARKHNFPTKMINQIKTALVEACINATEHSLSPDRKIYQKFVVDREKMTVTVANRGLRLLDTSGHEIVPDQGRRGWGLKLMKGLMDDVRIEQSDDGTRVTMVKYNKASQS